MRRFTLILASAMIATSVSAQMPNFDRQRTETNIKVPERLHSGKTSGTAKKAVANAPEISTEVISEQPEGTLKTYARAGKTLSVYAGTAYKEDQAGKTIDIVTAPDGQTIYLKDIISSYSAGTWVKGTIEGNRVHVPLYQCIEYLGSGYGYGYAIAKSNISSGDDSSTYETDLTATEMTFIISNGSTLILDETDGINTDGNPRTILSLIYTDDYKWFGYGDYQSKYYEFDETAKTMPEGLEVEEWNYHCYRYDDGFVYHGATLSAAIDGDKFYIQGLSEADPLSVIEGTINGDKVTFASNQFIGPGSGYMLYFCGGKGQEKEYFDVFTMEYYKDIKYYYSDELVMNYDAEKKTLTTVEDDDAILFHIGSYSDYLKCLKADVKPSLEQNAEEDLAATPATPKISSLDDSNYSNFGWLLLKLNVKIEDTEGNYINPDKLYYIIWVKTGDNAEKFVFTADKYHSFADDGIDELVEVPYNFESFDYTGWPDISVGGTEIYFYSGGFDDYGVQSVYYGGDERRESEIGWYYNFSTGVESVSDSSAAATAVSFFSIDGRKLDSPQKGINIVIMSDGSVRKMMFK